MSRNPDNPQLDKDLWQQYRNASHRYRATACLDINTQAAYIEGNISAPQLSVMEAHLAFCSTCLETVMVARTQLAEPSLPAPEHLILQAKALVPQADKKHRVVFPWHDWLAWLLLPRKTVEWASVAAAVAVAGVCGFAIGQDMYVNSRTINLLVSSELSFNLDEPPGGPFISENGEFLATYGGTG